MRMYKPIILTGILLSPLFLSCASGPRKALWKCVEMDQDSSAVVDDSLARLAYNYYSRHGSVRDRMMATYYLGQAELDAGQSIPATLHFRQAYDLASRAKDTSYMGFSCQRMSQLYAHNLDNALSAHYARQAIPLFEHIGDTLSANFSRIHLTGYYLSLWKFDYAESIIDSLLTNKGPDWTMDYYASIVKANIRFFQDDYDCAEVYYNQAASLYPLSPLFSGRLALIAEHQGKRELSDSLLRQTAESISTKEDSINYFTNKAQIAVMRGDYETAFHNQSLAYSLQDSCVNDILSRSVTHAMQAYFEQEYQAEKVRRENQGTISLLSILILLAITIAVVIALRRRKEQIVTHMAQMETLHQELLQMRKGQAGSHAIISTLVQDRIKSMSQLADAYLSWSDEAVVLREVRHGKTFKEDIISEFRKELRTLRDDKNFIPSIEDALNHSHGDIITRIRQDCKGFRNGDIRVNEKDFQLLILFFAGFSNNSVAFMMDMTDDAVRTRKKNLRKVFLSMENKHGKEYLSMLSGESHKSATSST